MQRLTGAEAIVRGLRNEGVRFAFGLAGGKLMPLMHALSREPGIRYTGVRHEAAAPLMAAGIAAGSGEVALAFGEMGPGAGNLLAGVGSAYNNNLPMVLVTTNQHRAAAYPHRGMFMDVDAKALFAPLTKWNATVQDGRRLPELIRTAFRRALSGRPGPVHLDVPQDVLGQPVDFADDAFALPPSRYRSVSGPRPDAAELARAAQLLADARRPLLVAGGGVVAAGATDALRTLAARLSAPVFPTQMALGVVASDSPHFIGHGGIIGGDAWQRAFAEADVVLAIGCRFSSWMWNEHGPLSGNGARLVSINIDPEVLGEPALHQLGIVADARAALDDLLAALPAAQPSSERAAWLQQLRSIDAAYRDRLRTLAADTGEPMHPAALAQRLAAALPGDALAVYDGGHTTFWSNDFTPVSAPRTRLHEPGMSQLGFGLPFALALQLLHPGRPVVNITGDGAFGFTMQELDTARRYGLPVVNVIHDNAAWGIIRAGQRKALDFSFGADLEGTDYAAIARGFGCHGETVIRPDDVGPALQRAIASGQPAVIDCKTRFEPHPAMPAFGRMNSFGFPNPQQG